MATREITVLICDVCGATDDNEGVEVISHTLAVDKHAATLEACGPCWPADELAALLNAGRRNTTRVRSARQ